MVHIELGGTANAHRLAPQAAGHHVLFQAACSRAGIKKIGPVKPDASATAKKDYEREGFTEQDATTIAASAAFGILLQANTELLNHEIAPSSLKALSTAVSSALEILRDLSIITSAEQRNPPQLIVRVLTEDEEQAIRNEAELGHTT